ncbi:ATP-binding cassette domain-containing protein [Blastomonas sp. SL216]|uniref:ATP-binding cassette domain-containing protein n=1 Tax=Blastomonas sp. SL216 TaxID=2995169 RepID=UPI0023775E6A|nr:ATP-binding cassette domain-containing protein [Blastomonas sp. SL216]
MRELLDQLPGSVPEASRTPIAFRHSITLSAIRVSRPDRGDTLKGLDLVVPYGGRIGIVGASGSGKSTLLDVLSGLITPVEGMLQVDGQEITSANAAAWRDRMGVVSQNVLLVGHTLREAISFPVRSEDTDQERLLRAVEQTGLTEFVASLSHGLDTALGETMSSLSGGQRQRIALAHALYRAHDLLVLDEATSQLDMESEAVIRSCLQSLPRHIAIVLVTHRTALLDCCDIVYRLEDGRLTQVKEAAVLVAEGPDRQSR